MLPADSERKKFSFQLRRTSRPARADTASPCGACSTSRRSTTSCRPTTEQHQARVRPGSPSLVSFIPERLKAKITSTRWKSRRAERSCARSTLPAPSPSGRSRHSGRPFTFRWRISRRSTTWIRRSFRTRRSFPVSFCNRLWLTVCGKARNLSATNNFR